MRKGAIGKSYLNLRTSEIMEKMGLITKESEILKLKEKIESDLEVKEEVPKHKI